MGNTLVTDSTRHAEGNAWTWSNDTLYHPFAEGRLSHAYFVGSIEHAILGMLPDVSGDLTEYASNHGSLMALYRDHEVPGIEGCRADVMVEMYDKDCIVGEAKASREDLCNRSHTNTQIQSYMSYLYKRHEDNPDIRCTLIIGVPFHLSSEARRIFNDNLRRLTRSDPDGFGASSPRSWLGFKVSTEIDGKDIPPLEGTLSEEELLGERSYGQYPLNGKCYKCVHGYMKIDALTLDPGNVRFDEHGREPTPDECLKKLLDEDDVKSNGMNTAIDRKRSFIDDRTINEELEVFVKESNGSRINLVVDGNSRLANCRDIVSRAHSAPGYEVVPVRMFSESSGITEEMIKDIKEHEQHKTILPHDKARIAINILEMLEAGGSYDDVRRRYIDLRSKDDGTIQSYADAVKALLKAGCDPEYMTMAYNPVWAIIVAERASCGTCRFKGFDMERIVERLVKETEDGGGFGDRYSNLSHAIATRRKTIKQQGQIRRWIEGEYDNDDEFGRDWKENGRRDHTIKPENLRKTLERMSKEAEGVRQCIKSLDSRPKGLHGRGGLTESAMHDIYNMSDWIISPLRDVRFIIKEARAAMENGDETGKSRKGDRHAAGA